MSDQTELDLRAELARIDRDRAETNKLFAETIKFGAERHKLEREAEKLRAEEHKLWRDWRMAPWVFAVGVIGAIIGGLLARHLL
ncbi:MAG TPA: hypothetical protein VL614_00765 [Acetobacteraceae bacterium]|jgi:anti-sigma factor RsiW|nr:hypothetical protein [Acetobacteraceae bacterium]